MAAAVLMWNSCSRPAYAAQVHELGAMRVVHASRYPGAILSMGMAPDCSLLAVGLADGTLSLRKHAKAGKAAPGTPPLSGCGILGA